MMNSAPCSRSAFTPANLAALSGLLASLERTSAEVAPTLGELRQLLLAESGTLSAKIEEKYQNALDVLAGTAAQIRHDMVYRSSLSGMLTEVAVKLSGQWPHEGSSLLAIHDARPDAGRDMTAEDEPYRQDHGSGDA